MTDFDKKLKWLCERADLAKKLTDKLKALNDASPYQSGVRLKFTKWSNDEPIIDEDLLKKIVAAGREALIKTTTEELDSVLAVATPEATEC